MAFCKRVAVWRGGSRVVTGGATTLVAGAFREINNQLDEISV
jgi:hypothetical protein